MKLGTTLLALAALVGGLSATASARAGDIVLPARIKDAGVIRASVDAAFPPMNFKDASTGEYKGAGVEIVQALAKKLGVKLQFVEASYPQLMPGLETGRFDFIGSAMVDFPNRRDKLTFADYLDTGPQAFTRLENEKTIAKPSDLCGKSVAHARFVTSYKTALEALSTSDCTAKGKAAIDIRTDDLPVQIGLVQHRYDAGVVTAESVTYIMQTEPNTYYKIGAPLRGWHYGFAFSKSDTELRDAVAKAVQAVIDDGTYAEILKKYGLSEQAIDSVKIDAGEF